MSLFVDEEAMRIQRNSAYRDAVLAELEPMLEPGLYDIVSLHSMKNIQSKKKTKPFSRRYKLFMVAAMLVSALILTFYVTVRAGVEQQMNHNAQLQNALNELRLDNDDAYNKTLAGVNLDEIRDIALNEYGMIYAEQGQIVRYDEGGGKSDFVKQTGEIPAVAGAKR